jgi:hypothetical protein
LPCQYARAPFYFVWPSREDNWREGLQLGFAAIDAKEICRDVQELAIALDQVRRGNRKLRRNPPTA